MKIVHICLCGPMSDGFNYQENVLTKYHKKMGLDVVIIASQYIWGKNGKIEKTEKSRYVNEDGVSVVRFPCKNGDVNSRFKWFPHLYNELKDASPDIIFVHDCQFLNILTITKYAKKHPNTIVYIDNHVDYSNGARGWLSRNILHKVIWKYCVKRIEPYTRKFYGVLPARVRFLSEMYNIPEEKCELLVMGADDELVRKSTDPQIRREIRQKYGISNDDFLIVTGGKINHFRPETLSLMKAVKQINNKKVKLIVFGVVAEELRKEFENLCDGEHIIYAGWQTAEQTYRHMASADLIIFPGLHSVMWEQAVGLGIPCVFRRIPGFEHVDLGGNCHFINDASEKKLKEEIMSLLENIQEYEHMKIVAESNGIEEFSYQQIARKSLEIQ